MGLVLFTGWLAFDPAEVLAIHADEARDLVDVYLRDGRVIHARDYQAGLGLLANFPNFERSSLVRAENVQGADELPVGTQGRPASGAE